MFYRTLCSCSLLILLGGCATLQTSLQVEALAPGKSAPTRLAVDGTLQSGDQFALHINVPQAAYVYAVRPTRPKAERLFPESGHNLVDPRAPLYIPGAGNYFKLDDKPGTEHIAVVVSLQTLSEDEINELVHRRSELRSRDTSEPNEEPREGSKSGKDESSSDKDPPIVTPIDKPGSTYVVRARLSEKRPAVMRFKFQHTARPQTP